MSIQASSSIRSAIACPFCGLACDDLQVDTANSQANVIGNGCPRSVVQFRPPLGNVENRPAVDGRIVSLPEAVAAAARILAHSAQPLLAGLGTDVAGTRAALQLADCIGAVVDHMNRGLARNMAVVQDTGWLATTFAEVQNRADLVVFAGTDAVSRFPRFFERILGQRESMFSEGAPQREIVYIGAKPGHPKSGNQGSPGEEIPCTNLGEAFGALRACLAGKRLQAEHAGGIAITELVKLAERMRSARYGVLVWVATDLDYAHAELTIQAMSNLVSDLNEHTRFACLPISGSDGDMTANQVTVWQTGFPLRTGFGRGTPDYDPHHFSCERLLATGEADALLWISAFDAERLPPPSNVSAIVLGRPGMKFEKPPAVYIPVATPGVHHAGHFFRGDNVVAVRLRKLVDSPLPAVADVLAQIEAAL